MKKKNIPVWLVIFLTAYILRFIYVLEISKQPYFTAPSMDPEYHDRWAQAIAEGNFNFEPGPFFRAPLYPYFLGAVYYIFGHDYFIIRIIQILLGSLTCVFTYYLGKRLFNQRVGTIAGFTAALTGIFIYFDAELLIAVILLPLALGFFLALLKALDSEKPAYWALSGLLFGLFAIARPNILIFSPVLLSIICRKADIKRRILRGSLVLLGILIPLTPVTLHNIHQGEFVLIATQGGVNFYIGNNPQADGAAAVFPGLGNAWRYSDAIDMAEKETGRKMKYGEISDFYYDKALDYIFDKPDEWLKLMGRKFLLLINNIEISNNKNIYFSAKDSVALTLLLNNGFWLYGSLGMIGMGMFYRKRYEYKLVVWFALLYGFSFMLFFITARYRLPIIPFMIIFGAAAVDWALEKIKTKNYQPLKIPTIIFILLIIITSANFLKVRKIVSPYAHLSLGNAYLKKNNLDEAEKEFLKAAEADPYYKQIYLNLGVIYYERRQYDKAEEYFLKELYVNKGLESAFALNNIGNIRVQQGILEEAYDYYNRALAVYPNYKDGRDNLTKISHELALIKIKQDSLEKARDYLMKAIELEPGVPVFRYHYGLVMGEMGDENKAMEEMRKITLQFPDFQPAKDVLKKRGESGSR